MTLETRAVAGAAAPPKASAWERWAPLGGVGFGVLFVAGAVIGFNSPDDTAPDKDWVNWYSGRGNQVAMLVSGFLLVFAAICLVVLVAALRDRIAAARGGGTASPLPLALTAVGAAGMCAGAVVNATIAGAAIFGHLPHMLSADILRLLSNLTFPLITVAGLIPVAAALGILSVEARAAGVFGAKMQVATVIGALAALAAFMFFPLVLVVIWAITASIVLLRTGERQTAATLSAARPAVS